MANITKGGLTENLAAQMLAEIGFVMAIYPFPLISAAKIKAVKDHCRKWSRASRRIRGLRPYRIKSGAKLLGLTSIAILKRDVHFNDRTANMAFSFHFYIASLKNLKWKSSLQKLYNPICTKTKAWADT